jgi:tetratricopeptide (TPR) repeat protein
MRGRAGSLTLGLLFLGLLGCNRQGHIKAIELNNEAIGLHDRELNTQAIEKLTEALRFDPDCVECHQTLARIYQDTKSWPDAATHYKASAELGGQVKDLSNWGYVLYLHALQLAGSKDTAEQAKVEGRLKEAEDVLNRAIKADPEAYLSYYYLGQVYREQDRFEEAGKVLRSGIDKNPGFPEAFNEYGKLFSELELWDQAEAVFKEGLKINTNAGMLYNQLGLVYKETGRYQDAINALNSAIKDDKVPEAYFNMGVTYYEMGSSQDKKNAEFYLGSFTKSGADKDQKALAEKILTDLRQEASQ